jgi:hypothetical protein
MGLVSLPFESDNAEKFLKKKNVFDGNLKCSVQGKKNVFDGNLKCSVQDRKRRRWFYWVTLKEHDATSTKVELLLYNIRHVV